MNYVADLANREGEIEGVIHYFDDPNMDQIETFRARVADLGLNGETVGEIKKVANNKLDVLRECRLSIAALGVGVQLDQNPDLGGGKVALGHVVHGESGMHLASFDHMESVAKASGIGVVDVLEITAEHEKLHIGLHSHRTALGQVITGITGNAQDAHAAEEGAVSIESESSKFDAYEPERARLAEIAAQIHVSRNVVVGWVTGGKVEEMQKAANDAGYGNLGQAA